MGSFSKTDVIIFNSLGNTSYLGQQLTLKSVKRLIRRILLTVAKVDLQIETEEEKNSQSHLSFGNF